MKGFLLYLWLGGAILYSINTLVLTQLVEPESQVAEARAPAPQGPDPEAGRTVSSWGSYLNPQKRSKPKPAPVPSPPDVNLLTEAVPTTNGSTPARTDDTGKSATNAESGTQVDLPERDHLARVTVLRSAAMRSYGSVSSPLVRYYSPGTQLQLIEREGDWAKVRDPNSNEVGWIYEPYYLAGVTAAGPVQAALEPKPEPSVEVKPPKKRTKNARQNRLAKPTPQVADVVFPEPEARARRWSKRSARRGQGLFMLGPPGF